MIKVEGTTKIGRPIGEVFSFVTEPANDPRWLFDVVESTATSDARWE